MVFIYPSGNSDHKQDHSYKRKRRNRFWVYAIATPCKGILKMYKELGGEILTIGSDSHAPGQLGFNIAQSQEMLKDLGFEYFCTFEKMKPIFHKL